MLELRNLVDRNTGLLSLILLCVLIAPFRASATSIKATCSRAFWGFSIRGRSINCTHNSFSKFLLSFYFSWISFFTSSCVLMIMRTRHCWTLIKGALLTCSISRCQTSVALQSIASWSTLAAKLVVLVVMLVILFVRLQMECQAVHSRSDFDSEPVP